MDTHTSMCLWFRILSGDQHYRDNVNVGKLIAWIHYLRRVTTKRKLTQLVNILCSLCASGRTCPRVLTCTSIMNLLFCVSSYRNHNDRASYVRASGPGAGRWGERCEPWGVLCYWSSEPHFRAAAGGLAGAHGSHAYVGLVWERHRRHSRRGQLEGANRARGRAHVEGLEQCLFLRAFCHN